MLVEHPQKTNRPGANSGRVLEQLFHPHKKYLDVDR